MLQQQLIDGEDIREGRLKILSGSRQYLSWSALQFSRVHTIGACFAVPIPSVPAFPCHPDKGWDQLSAALGHQHGLRLQYSPRTFLQPLVVTQTMNIDIDSACIYGPQTQTRPLTATWTLTSSRPQLVAQVSRIRLFFTSITSPVLHSAQTTPLLFLSHFSATYLFASYSVRAGHMAWCLRSQIFFFYTIHFDFGFPSSNPSRVFHSSPISIQTFSVSSQKTNRHNYKIRHTCSHT